MTLNLAAGTKLTVNGMIFGQCDNDSLTVTGEGELDMRNSDFGIRVDSDAVFTALWKDDGSGSVPGTSGGDDGYAPQRAWKIKLAPMVNGRAALGIMTGESTRTEMNVYPTTTIYVFPEPDPGYTLDRIIWSYIDGTASYDTTEARNFIMPSADVVVTVTFKPIS